MANEKKSVEIGFVKGASYLVNGSTSKIAEQQVADKVDDLLTLDEPQEAAKKKKKKSKSKKKNEPSQQTDPPSIPVVELFTSGEFPEGEIQQTTSEEKRELERLEKPIYNSVRQAAPSGSKIHEANFE